MATFRDRKDAGEQLAMALEKYKNQNPLVIGIPRGGVETAYYVAKYLNAELTLIVTRKLGYPEDPEFAFGALAEDGSMYLSKMATVNLSEEARNEVIEKQKVEILRRIQKLRGGKPLPEIKGRTVIIVDDGIATGATLFATIMLCQNKKAGKIVVAAPVSGYEMLETLAEIVDDVVILENPYDYHAVSQVYDHFYTLTDEEALEFLEKWQKEFSQKNQ